MTNSFPQKDKQNGLVTDLQAVRLNGLLERNSFLVFVLLFKDRVSLYKAREDLNLPFSLNTLSTEVTEMPASSDK